MCRWAASILNSFRSDQNKKGSLPLKGRLPFLFEIIQKENAEKEKTFRYNRKVFLAEREGFEPSRAFRALHDFQSCALDQLSHLSIAARQRRTARAIIAKQPVSVKAFFDFFLLFFNDGQNRPVRWRRSGSWQRLCCAGRRTIPPWWPGSTAPGRKDRCQR